jgi:MSHA biogenesis protein MshI
MGWFAKVKKIPGWMAISFSGDGICAANIKHAPNAKPMVELSVFYPLGKIPAAELLEKIGKDLNLKRYQCTTLLKAGDYQLLSVDAPNVPADELKTALRWRLKDMIDYPVDDATMDILDVPVDPNAPVRNHSMFAVVARNQVIEQHQSLFVKAKVSLSVIDIPELAQRNISALLEPAGRGLALLSFTAEGGLLTITYAGELYLSRRIDVSLDQLTTTDINLQTASYDKITLELQRSLDHFDRQHHYIALSKLLLTPMGEAGTGLHEYLASNLYTPVEILDLDSVLDFSKVPDLQEPTMQQRFFMALGAALRLEETAS